MKLIEMLATFGSLEKAQEAAEKAVISDKSVYIDLLLLLCAQGKLDHAYSLCQEVDKYLITNKRYLFNKGYILIAKGYFKEGFELLDSCREEGIFGSKPIPTIQPVAKSLSDIKDKILLVGNEGGLGDEILYFRYKDILKSNCKKLIFAADSSLIKIFSNQDNVDAVIDRRFAPAVYHDCWIPSMSLPLFCGSNYSNIEGKPYIKVDEKSNNIWKAKIKTNKFKIGIRWSGDLVIESQLFRTFPIEKILDLANNKNIQLYSFQRDNDLRQLSEDIIDLKDELKTWDDTSAAINQMDLMISCCTSVLHMACAIGKKTFGIIPMLAYYTWAKPGNKSVWYDSITLFRQTKFGQWEDTLTNVTDEVEKLI